MHVQTLVAAVLTSVPLIAAHGKVAMAVGDAGGNGTALGIMGAVVPGAGRNKATEPDTTVFKGKNAGGCGLTEGGGTNDIEAGTKQAMALSGDTLPQITAGGSLSGTLHIVTSDGAGPYTAMLNTDGTGTTWTKLDVTTQVPGRRGNIRKTQKRWWARALDSVSVGLMKRATNINEDHPFKVVMPADVKCTGTIAGQANTCIVKMINPSNAGPFGGCIPVQQVVAQAAAAAPSIGSAAAAAPAGTPAKRSRVLRA